MNLTDRPTGASDPAMAWAADREWRMRMARYRGMAFVIEQAAAQMRRATERLLVAFRGERA